MDVARHILAIDEDDITSTKPIDRATLGPPKAHTKAKIALNLDPPPRSTILYSIDMECKDTPECVLHDVVDHHNMSKCLIYKVRWHRYTSEKQKWEPDGYVPCKDIADIVTDIP